MTLASRGPELNVCAALVLRREMRTMVFRPCGRKTKTQVVFNGDGNQLRVAMCSVHAARLVGA